MLSPIFCVWSGRPIHNKVPPNTRSRPKIAPQYKFCTGYLVMLVSVLVAVVFFVYECHVL